MQKFDRRSYLRLMAAGVFSSATPMDLATTTGDSPARSRPTPPAGTGPYVVGVGSSTDPYTATQRAVSGGDQWPGSIMAGRTVLIKPNLAAPKPSTTGVTTDPQVVRALVDLALAAGAAAVTIIENGTKFSACGYDFFSSYDPRVRLVDLSNQPGSLVAVPNGLAYKHLYLPKIALEPGVVLISAAKLKTHVNAHVTLSMKNLFGVPPTGPYRVVGLLPRQDLHYRGVDESTVDLNLARPINFAVIDGVWGLEGDGPLTGTPVAMNLVIAGLNPVAVDRVGLEVMGIAQSSVPHLVYASKMGLGPSTSSAINVVGDPFTPHPFTPAQTPPIVWRPVVNPTPFSPGSGQQTSISYGIPSACSTLVEIIEDNDSHPAITQIRQLHDWVARPSGGETLTWDGRDNAGALVAPAGYLVRVQARANSGPTSSKINYATSRVTVVT
jgi:uncharacterized protein (DUF362 family)